MYMVSLKTILVEAARRTFNGDYTNPQMRNLYISQEYPALEVNYPGIWVDFSPSGDLSPVGIGHYEEDVSVGGQVTRYKRWYFQGFTTFTVAALSTLDRDLMFDEMARVMAFGDERPDTSPFRAWIEGNDWIATQMKWESIGQSGFASSPGTPWGTDEVISEATLRVETFGEFLSDGLTRTIVPLSAIDSSTYVYEDQYTSHEGMWG